MANPQPDHFTKISNELLEAFAKIRILPDARRMLDVIVRLTYGYRKTKAIIPTILFIQMTGMNRDRIYKSRRKLLEMSLIGICQAADTCCLTYWVQKDYEKWRVSAKRQTVCQTADRVSAKRHEKYLPNGRHHIIKKERKLKESIDTQKYFYLKDPEFKEAWDSWLEVRKKKRAPDTKRALEISLKKLMVYSMGDAIEMLEQSIERGYTGVFPVKDKDRQEKGTEPKKKSTFQQNFERFNQGSDRFDWEKK